MMKIHMFTPFVKKKKINDKRIEIPFRVTQKDMQ